MIRAFGPVSCLLSRNVFKLLFFLEIGFFLVLPLLLVVVFSVWEMISWSVVSAACYLLALALVLSIYAFRNGFFL